ncbi:unnamed protein product [Pleuronectes platessa]|uniref:Uncharacterized protein n=1 Tax=Pleuronectes platessa TaxID=8262 RepID=A0A9N7TNQ9_PLEPL|nr:unnamed protein product [Pleuronectes platessa]
MHAPHIEMEADELPGQPGLTSSSSTCPAPLLHPEMFVFFQFHVRHVLETSSTRPLAHWEASTHCPAAAAELAETGSDALMLAGDGIWRQKSTNKEGRKDLRTAGRAAVVQSKKKGRRRDVNKTDVVPDEEEEEEEGDSLRTLCTGAFDFFTFKTGKQKEKQPGVFSKIITASRFFFVQADPESEEDEGSV